MNSPDSAELGWNRFLRGVYGLLLASLAILGVVLILLLLQGTRWIIGQTISAEGQTLARSVARGVFVPLALEDEARLAAWLVPLAAEPHLVEARVFDGSGTLRARIGGAARSLPSSAVFKAPVGAVGTGEVVGSVEIALTGQPLRRRLDEVVGWGAAFVILLMALVYLIAAASTQSMTQRLRGVLDEAALVERLRRSNADLEQFAAVASHDLKEPLRKITTFSQLIASLSEEERREKSGDYLRRMNDAAARMQQLIDDLLEYSRIGHVQETPETLEMGGIVGEAMANLQEAIDQSGATIRIGRLPRMRMHRLPMVRLVQNLVANAIKFSGEETPVIEIAERRIPGRRAFAIKDNGIGIDPKHHERIFGVFSRLHSRAQYPGSGIGLAACRRIVELQGGEILVESAEGKGSSFVVSLPLARE